MLLHYNLSPSVIRLKKGAIKLTIPLLLLYNWFLNAIRPKGCVLKLSILVILYLILFLINESPKNGVVMSGNPFMLNYCLDRFKTQEMCNKAVDFCLLALNFVPD